MHKYYTKFFEEMENDIPGKYEPQENWPDSNMRQNIIQDKKHKRQIMLYTDKRNNKSG